MKNNIKLGSRVAPKVTSRPVWLYITGSVLLAGLIGFLLFLYLNIGKPSETKAAPPVNISGTINSYLRVTSVNVGTRTFTANNLYGNATDFQVGKTVMIYQAKGANISTNNNAAYGTVTAYNNAGNYEFAVISSIVGGPNYTIVVESLTNNYTSSGSVQLISVPEYVDAQVTGTITGLPWDASQGRGGVIAMQVGNELTLGANIDASGLGFQGGQTRGSNDDCPDADTYRSNSDDFAAKGESFSTDGRLYARGAQANAGGGGNPHNAGGGGGSNWTLGGEGGDGWQPGGGCSNEAAGGLPGKKINYTSMSKLFFGGGGGAGQQNNNNASSGARGGGIIVVRAKTIKSTCGGTYGLISDGLSATNATGNDGAGGGGGGGVVLLDVMGYDLTCPIFARTNGGNGGSVNDAGAHGGGGGGGIGVIMETFETSDPNVTLFSTPGTNGRDCNTAACNTPSGALPETPSAYSIGISNIVGTVAPLPIELVSFSGTFSDDGVTLKWVTASEENNDYFTLERSADGVAFTAFEEVDGAGNSTAILRYESVDKSYLPGHTYYRLKQTDFDGKFSYSDIIRVETGPVAREFRIYPNPASTVVNITKTDEDEFTIRLVNQQGVEILRQTLQEETTSIDVSDVEEGMYVIETVGSSQRRVERLIIKR